MTTLYVGSNSGGISSEFGLRVSMGLEEGMSIVDKFGSNPDVTTGGVPEWMWTLGGEYEWGNDAGEPLFISSSSVGDTQTIEISVLTLDGSGNWNPETFEVTLQGQATVPVVTPSGDPVVRCFRMENITATDLVGQVYAYYSDTVINGIPATQSRILAHILDGNQTRQLMYTIPSGYWGFLYRGEAGCSRSSGTNEMNFEYQSRRVGRTFTVKKKFACMTSGQNNYLDNRTFPDIIPAKTDLGIKIENVSATMGAWGSFFILLVSDERFQKEQAKAGQ